MAHTYDIRAAYLYLKNPVFSNMDIIKQIKIYPPANDGTSRILVIYEVEDVLPEEDNGHYLSIDLGLHNLMTCYDNVGKTFIIGREYLSLSYFSPQVSLFTNPLYISNHNRMNIILYTIVRDISCHLMNIIFDTVIFLSIEFLQMLRCFQILHFPCSLDPAPL